MVEKYCANIIQVTVQRKKTSPSLIRPHLDLVIISSRHEEGLCFMEVDSSNRSIVLFESVNQRAHAIVP